MSVYWVHNFFLFIHTGKVPPPTNPPPFRFYPSLAPLISFSIWAVTELFPPLSKVLQLACFSLTPAADDCPWTHRQRLALVPELLTLDKETRGSFQIELQVFHNRGLKRNISLLPWWQSPAPVAGSRRNHPTKGPHVIFKEDHRNLWRDCESVTFTRTIGDDGICCAEKGCRHGSASSTG